MRLPHQLNTDLISMDRNPKLDMQRFFNGRIEGAGVIQDRGGRLKARFLAHMDCHWDGNRGVFDEVFTYLDDGAEQHRTWQVELIDDDRFTATAGDILGTAQGRAWGNALQWRYRMDVPLGSGGLLPRIRLSFDDWMWALDERQVFNRSTMTKFGLRVAELSCYMRKVHD